MTQKDGENRTTSDPTDPYSRHTEIFPVLSNEQILRCKPFGTTETVKQGTVLFERGDRSVDFFIILEGNIEIYEHKRLGLNIVTVHGKHQFTGELDLFNDRQILVGGRMGVDGKVIRMSSEQFQKFMIAEPEIADIVMKAFILRRMGLITHNQASVSLITTQESPDSLRIERFLKRNGYPIEVLNYDLARETHTCLSELGISKEQLPAVFIHQGEQLLHRPSNQELAETLGLVERIEPERIYDLAIVGGGPAGLSAAVYAASEGLDVVLLEAEAPGGQAGTSSKIENYLGFPTGVSGQELADRAQVQAQKFGARIVLPNEITHIHCEKRPFKLATENGLSFSARAIVIASGACYRRLQFNHSFDNAGVYYAATAMESNLCKHEEIIIVGGGNSAGQAAIFLSGQARHVHMLIRSNSLSASMSDYLINRINSAQNITLHKNTEIISLNGTRHLQEVTWQNRETGETETHPIKHVFLMLGAMPNTKWLRGCLALDEKGFIMTGTDLMEYQGWQQERYPMMLETSVPGIFAAGDVRSGSIKRVASAVGEGAMAISQVHQYLSLEMKELAKV